MCSIVGGSAMWPTKVAGPVELPSRTERAVRLTRRSTCARDRNNECTNCCISTGTLGATLCGRGIPPRTPRITAPVGSLAARRACSQRPDLTSACQVDHPLAASRCSWLAGSRGVRGQVGSPTRRAQCGRPPGRPFGGERPVAARRSRSLVRRTRRAERSPSNSISARTTASSVPMP